MPCHNAIALTSLMLGHAEDGNGELALELFSRMEDAGCPPDARTLVAATKACGRLALREEFTHVEGRFVRVASLERGISLHDQAARLGFDSDRFLASSMIEMYAKCGSMEDAKQVFDKLDSHDDVILWNALMLGYAENGEGELAMDLFELMRTKGCSPNARTVVAGCKACADMGLKEEGKVVLDGKLVSLESLEKSLALHSEAAKRGYDSDIFVSSTVIDMYAKCGSMRDSRLVFDRMVGHNVVAWNSLILGYAENGEPELSLELFRHMRPRGCLPDACSFVAATKACSYLAVAEEGKQVDGMVVKLESLEKGMGIHLKAAQSGYDLEIVVTNTLLDMYAKCGSLVDSRRIFDRMCFHSVVSWNALLLGYVENRKAELALEMFEWISEDGCQPNASTLVAALKACTTFAADEEKKEIHGLVVKLQALEKGLAIHSQAAEIGCVSEAFVATTLVDMYAKCGSLLDSRKVFDTIREHSVVSWNALMLGYAENSEGDTALELLAEILAAKVCAPNSSTFVGALKACVDLAAKEEGTDVEGKLVKLESLEKAMEVHLQAAGHGFENGILFANALLDTFSRCGSLMDARIVFDKMPQRSVVSWTALVMAYVDCGEPKLALEVFSCMEPEGLLPNAYSFAAAIRACSVLGATEEAKEVEGRMVKAESLGTGAALHSQAFKSGYDMDVSVANALVDMYVKCGSLADARKVFDGMTPQDPVSWNALILGYVTNGEAEVALSIFETNSSCVPTSRTFCAALKACSSLAGKTDGDGRLVKVEEALEKAVGIHARAASFEFDSDTFLASALVSFYAKCGSIRDAWKVFQKVRLHDAVSWTVMILGLAESGQGELSLQLFHRMRAQGYKTDAPTFVAALKASSSVGALEPLKGIHADISRCGLEDDPVVANGVVDGYGKAGDAAKAQQVFEALEKPDAVAWTSVIAAHSRDGDTRMVFKLFDEMQDEGLQPDGIALLCVLTACSHAGLVHHAKRYFKEMEAKYGVRPGAEHYHCMVDALGRANELEEAVEMVEAMPCEASGVAWRTVLGACKKWKHAAVGRLAFDRLVEVEARDEAGYLLMEAIYASSGMREEQAQVQELRRKNIPKNIQV
ncbi:pentatricopeptide repeat-containing protein At5g27110-like [Selaginella moellendorffii]|uniref:pentatricopeptide repeat-containing protein At5g27110-like n=1 Tax=Selaginella moellendorffii TaxID=88036 RepID=UPI000D1CCBBB|nr:pentatricopeptide repeat-containing protein At5g27110-like [Selaginella moellendorffii]|eukprot:XP_024518017.1 pentatricopeptide repeat-containing protein At5g27110-like [Selaginella moellendorffii]